MTPGDHMKNLMIESGLLFVIGACMWGLLASFGV